MAEKIISPAVFTRENDESFIQRGLGEIGAAVIGRTPKGIAFEPILVNDFDEFRTLFGEKDPDHVVPYMAAEYLKDGAALTVIRTLGVGEIVIGEGEIHIVSGSTLLAVIRAGRSGSELQSGNTSTLDGFITDPGSAADSASFTNFNIHLTASNDVTVIYESASLVFTDDRYIGNLIGTDPKGTGDFYLAEIWSAEVSSAEAQFITASFQSDGSESISLSSSYTPAYTTDYAAAVSPIAISQTIASSNHQLFQFTSLDHGDAANQNIKIAVFAVQGSGSIPGSDYGQFGIIVRRYGDTDTAPEVLETYNAVNLDPLSADYIGKRIGDQFITVDADGRKTLNGDYPNLSKYVRVTVLQSAQVPKHAVPFGFDQLKKWDSTALDAEYKISQSLSDGTFSNRVYFGEDFTHIDINNYHQALSTNAANASASFLLENQASHSADGFGNKIALGSPLEQKQFIFGLQNGFDAVHEREVFDNQLIFTSVAESGTVAYRKAIDSVKSPDEYDFNLLVIPETNYRQDSAVLSYALDAVEDRADAMMVLDLGPLTDSLATVTDTGKLIDSSYAAAYFPYVKIFDDANNRYLWEPPSVVLPGVFAFTDKVSNEWFAPAGLNRGGLTNIFQVYSRLNAADRDALYTDKVNPIATFPDVGFVVWGQKTLQAKSSALDRVNVRRMLIKVKKLVATVSKFLLFEQNNSITWSKFKNLVNPILEDIRTKNGIQEFQVVMDDTTNTPDVIDRNEMRGKIIIRPTKSAEFIVLDFNILPTGGAIFE